MSRPSSMAANWEPRPHIQIVFWQQDFPLWWRGRSDGDVAERHAHAAWWMVRLWTIDRSPDVAEPDGAPRYRRGVDGAEWERSGRLPVG